MKKFSLVILLVLPFFRLFAQETNEAGFTIEGSVQDAGKLALKDEVVFLYAKADSVLIKTEFTDESGIFRFQQI